MSSSIHEKDRATLLMTATSKKLKNKEDGKTTVNSDDAVMEEFLALRRVNVGLIRLLVALRDEENKGLSTRELLERIKSVDYGQRMIKKAEEEGYIKRVAEKRDRGARGESHVVVNYITPKGRDFVNKIIHNYD